METKKTAGGLNLRQRQSQIQHCYYRNLYTCSNIPQVYSTKNLNGEAPPWGGGVLPYKRLMEMCCWIGLHFHDQIDYNGVSYFSIELLEWGHTFSDFWG